jgi:myosin heavy subunit
MLRIIKYSAGALLAVFIGGFLLFGSDLTGMVRTSAKALQKSVKQSVPVEFELERAKQKINQILPDLQSQVLMIAEEEVAIARLTKDVQRDQQRLDTQETKLSTLRDQMRTTQVSYSVSNRNMNRQQFTEHLHSRFNHVKQAKLSLESKQKLLEKRTEGLNAALSMLDQMRLRQSELQLKVESLAAQNRLIKANQIESGTLIDGSQLSQADQLLDQIETRLAVADRVLDYREDVLDVPAEETVADEASVLAAIDSHFAPPTTELASKIAVIE